LSSINKEHLPTAGEFMAKTHLSSVLAHLRSVFIGQDASGLSDAELLKLYLRHRDEAAFEALVRRHGPMVLGVCRRVLRNGHDAEDAFQAALLVLVRKAPTLRSPELVANWLYGVAYRTALEAKKMAAKRRTKEAKAASSTSTPEDAWANLRPVLDQELERLPNKYRSVLVLCDLEGKTRKEAARQLGWPEGTVASRLASARQTLARRLVRHRLALSEACVAGLVSQNALASLTPDLIASTIRAATLLATGHVARGLISTQVVALTQGVLKWMLLAKLKIVGAMGLALALAILSSWEAATLVLKTRAAAQGSPTKDAAVPQPKLLSSGPPRLQLQYQSVVGSLAWSANGKQVAIGTQDGTIHVVDTADGKEIVSFVVGTDSGEIAFSPDGKQLAILQKGPVVSVWDTSTGKALQKRGGAITHKPSRLAFLPDGSTIMGVGPGSLYQWGWWSAKAMGSGGTEGFAAIAPDGLVSGWCDAVGQCRFYTYDANNPNWRLATLQVGPARCISFGPGGKFLAVGGGDKNVQVWDLPARKPIAKFSELDKPADKLAFSADGKTLAAVAGANDPIHVWDIARRSLRCRLNHNRSAVSLLALSPDGTRLATAAASSNIVYVWSTLPRLLGRTGRPRELAAEEFASLWTELGTNDPDKADAAWRTLGAAGDNAVPLLRERIRAVAVPAVDRKRIESLIGELDAEKFATREQASKELLAIGELAIVPLQRVLEKPPSEETRARAATILKKLGELSWTPDRQRVLDALELLEQVGTSMATGLLQEIERDALIPQIRSQAQQALQRLGQWPNRNLPGK
jgi:RNA polymerase sigma factor (sigma-70 family)